MPSESPSRDARLPLAHLLIPLATGAALYTYGSAQIERAAAVETLYLALVACAVLVPIAALAIRPALELSVSAVLVTLAVWVLPAGPVRGAAVILLLVLALATAVARSLILRERTIELSFAIPAAVGLQLLARSDQLLALQLDPKTLIGLVGLPIAVGIAIVILAREHSPGLVLVAAATAAILPPGWSVTVTLSLLALAAGSLARRASGPVWIRWGSVAVVAGVAYTWQPSLAALLALAVAAYMGARSWRVVLLVSVLALGTTLVFPEARSWGDVLAGSALVLLLLPALTGVDRERRSSLVAGLVLSVIALRVVSGPDALAAPLLLIALALAAEGTTARLQRLWTALLLGGSVLLAAYPWLRQEPLAELLGLTGLALDWRSAIAVAVVMLVLALAYRVLGKRSARTAMPEAGALAILGLAAWMALPPAGYFPFGNRIFSLSAGRASLATEIADIELEERVELSRVVLDSYLTDSTGLPTGTTVAVVELVDRAGNARSWPIEIGVHTGEWAARRPDVAALPGFAAPPLWLGWVAPSGDVFAQRYRAIWDLGGPIEPRSLSVTRAADLPPELAMAVFHLELRP